MELFNFLLGIPLAIGMPIFVSMVVLLSLGIYQGSHRLISESVTKEHERAGRVLFRTSAGLLALILSFTFANDRVLYYQIKDSLISEASQIVDMFMDLREYNTPEANRINQELLAYVNSVVDEGWVSVDKSPFEAAAMSEFRSIYQKIHDLVPNNKKQEYLLRDLYSDLDGLSDYMQVRIYQTNNDGHYVFYIVLVGLVVINILYGVYKPDRIKMLFLALYSGFIATIIYFMLIMSQPLKGPLQIRPEPFLILKDAIEARQ